MNTYVVTFQFEGEYHFARFTSDQFANAVLCDGESFDDFFEQYSNQKMQNVIWHNNKKYGVDISFIDSKLLDIFELEEGAIMARVPYLLLKIHNEDRTKNLYSISDYI